jgi:endonuclease/exonuclease/phosphatase family metal-dependent hydrolase
MPASPPPPASEAPAGSEPRRLRLASFNIQTGIATAGYPEYLTGSWQHVWPSRKRLLNLERIAKILAPFDLAGLQEVDGGGARSHHVVQAEYLAHLAGYPYWHNQINRRFGTLALHSNGLLSRLRPDCVEDHKLPGLPGRGALWARYGKDAATALYRVVVHLELLRQIRQRQLEYLAERIGHRPHVIMMGDFNCRPDAPELKVLWQKTGLCPPQREIMTFPSWSPRMMLDYILVTPALKIERMGVIHAPCSDHLPVSMEIELPPQLAGVV